MHPLEKFKYCPICGSSHFELNDEKSKICNNCGFEYYMNPSASTVAFIVNDKDELLVTRRAKEPAKGMLDLAGGFCDMDENAEEGITREVKEETGLEIIHTDYLFSLPNIYLYSGIKIHTMDLFFLCNVKDDRKIMAMDDAAECFWMPMDDIHTEQFGLRSIRQGLYKFIELRQQNGWKH
jgi:NADH pyrophosphatase NudC (nudix superfamily)